MIGIRRKEKIPGMCTRFFIDVSNEEAREIMEQAESNVSSKVSSLDVGDSPFS